MHTVLSGHSYMADLFPQRRETRTERKQWRFRPSVANAFDMIVSRRDKSEVDVAEEAIEKEARSLPLVDDVLQGARPETAEHYVRGWINPGDLLHSLPGDFLVTARSAALTGDSIQEGDLIHFRPQTECSDGDEVAVLLETAAGKRVALKRVRFIENSKLVRLFPMRSSEQAIELDTEKTPLEVLAVKKGLIRGN